LIVIVFDPLAVALIIAFNGMIGKKKKKQKEYIVDIIQNDEKLGLYEVYGDNIVNENEKNEINEKKEDESIVVNDNVADDTSDATTIDEDITKLQWESYMHPDFPWQKRSLWINNTKAVQYWLSTKKGSVRDFVKIKNEEENTKTY
jgi:hypothetical protein